MEMVVVVVGKLDCKSDCGLQADGRSQVNRETLSLSRVELVCLSCLECSSVTLSALRDSLSPSLFRLAQIWLSPAAVHLAFTPVGHSLAMPGSDKCSISECVCKDSLSLIASCFPLCKLD